jgi:hypothetical protein
MFTEEKPHLRALPLEPFRYYQYGERVVHLSVTSKEFDEADQYEPSRFFRFYM